MRTGFTILSKLSNKYKIYHDVSWEYEQTPEDREESKLWCQEIRGLHGVISPNGYDGSLQCYTDLVSRGKAFCKTIDGRIKQGEKGTIEIVFVFAPRYLDQVAAFIRAHPAKKHKPRGKPFQSGVANPNSKVDSPR